MAAQSSIPLPPSIEAVMEVNALAGSLRHVLPAFVSRFEDLYTAWKNTRSIEMSSSSVDSTDLYRLEYAALCNLDQLQFH